MIICKQKNSKTRPHRHPQWQISKKILRKVYDMQAAKTSVLYKIEDDVEPAESEVKVKEVFPKNENIARRLPKNSRERRLWPSMNWNN